MYIRRSARARIWEKGWPLKKDGRLTKVFKMIQIFNCSCAYYVQTYDADVSNRLCITARNISLSKLFFICKSLNYCMIENYVNTLFVEPFDWLQLLISYHIYICLLKCNSTNWCLISVLYSMKRVLITVN